ncbi:MAG: hypothetical protein ACRDRL_27630 [Sciscionella sp.]
MQLRALRQVVLRITAPGPPRRAHHLARRNVAGIPLSRLPLLALRPPAVTRKAVRIRLEQLLELTPRPPDEFYADWRCRLCGYHAGAVDRETALTTAALHLAVTHRATGGYHVPVRKRKR